MNALPYKYEGRCQARTSINGDPCNKLAVAKCNMVGLICSHHKKQIMAIAADFDQTYFRMTELVKRPRKRT